MIRYDYTDSYRHWVEMVEYYNNKCNGILNLNSNFEYKNLIETIGQFLRIFYNLFFYITIISAYQVIIQ